MSEELDRRVAIDVMKEEEPEEVTEEELDPDGWYLRSPGGNWWCTIDMPWTPLAFSTDFDVAMRAVDKVSDTAWLVLNYHNTDGPEWSATFSVLCHRLDVSKEEKCRIERATLSDASSAPEVICHALLAYVEMRKG